MNPQLVDLGTSIALLCVVVTVLSRVVLASTKELKDHLMRQDENQRVMDSRLTVLEAGQDGLKSDVAVLKAGQDGLVFTLGQISPRLERMDDNIIRVVHDLGEVKGELKRITPKERVGAD